MRPLLFVLFLAVSSACATTASATPAAREADQPVARFGDRTIALSEVDARANDELFKLKEQMFEVRTQAAERIALEAIVGDAAKKEKVTEEQWLETRVETGLKEPTEEELRGLFEKAKGRLPPGAEFEELKPTLKQAVAREARGQRARELFAELLKHAGYEVLLLEPAQPRKNVEAQGPSKGPANAMVTIVEFADFQCPYCGKAAAAAGSMLAAYPGQVRLVFRHFPLSFHEKAPAAAEAAACADEQGKFWAFHDAVFSNQDLLDEGDLRQHAEKAGLDAKKFADCVSSGRSKVVVTRDMEAGQKLGVTGTPAFFINGQMLSGAQPEEAFRRLIDKELGKTK